ncbi:MAG: DUF2079 domain-containing protein [bacterium]|nr:DUF2079 domain-containing protein [bacterium]
MPEAISHRAARTGLYGAGLVGLYVVYGVLARRVTNVVDYSLATPEGFASWTGLWAPSLVTLACGWLLVGGWRRRPGSLDTQPRVFSVRAGVPMVATAAVACAWMAGVEVTFPLVCVALVGCAWSLDLLGRSVGGSASSPWWDRWSPWILVGLILVCTGWHAAEQVRLWRQFMLGYADVGFFVTELEHCLPWKDVGPGRFADTRLGYHAVWVFYLLAPFYSVVRSPVFLMVVGPLALNLAAVPFYQAARARTGSGAFGLLVAIAWLALPSVSRLPYANTYGFQSIYLAVPWIAGALCLGVQRRWVGSHACLLLAVLCEETVCGVALGWGVYLVMTGERRRDGFFIVVLSLSYLALCAGVVIPRFTPAAEYTRVGLFGSLGVGDVVARWGRPRVGLFLLALLAPLAPGLVRGWKVLVVALPTLMLVALLREEDYLNIKYWHQSSVLPVLFLAAVLGISRPGRESSPAGSGGTVRLGPAVALACSALCFHQVFGLSPLAQAHRFSANRADAPFQRLRQDAVAFVQDRFEPEGTTIVATERLAAHFTHYRMVYPARRLPSPAESGPACVLVFDRSDGWDPLVKSSRGDAFLERARAEGFASVCVLGPIVILAR